MVGPRCLTPDPHVLPPSRVNGGIAEIDAPRLCDFGGPSQLCKDPSGKIRAPSVVDIARMEGGVRIAPSLGVSYLFGERLGLEHLPPDRLARRLDVVSV